MALQRKNQNLREDLDEASERIVALKREKHVLHHDVLSLSQRVRELDRENQALRSQLSLNDRDDYFAMSISRRWDQLSEGSTPLVSPRTPLVSPRAAQCPPPPRPGRCPHAAGLSPLRPEPATASFGGIQLSL